MGFKSLRVSRFIHIFRHHTASIHPSGTLELWKSFISHVFLSAPKTHHLIDQPQVQVQLRNKELSNYFIPPTFIDASFLYQVSDLSPKVTLMDLKTFFSYCGTVTDIQLERKVDQSQSALVTFMQPYALKTALLLNDAVIADSRIRVWSLKNTTSHSISDNVNYKQKNDEKQGGISSPTTHQSVVETMASNGNYKTSNKSKEDQVDGKYYYKISEKGRAVLVQQTRMAIAAAEQTAHLDDCFSAGALWVSGVLDKAVKYTAELGNHGKRRITSSRK